MWTDRKKTMFCTENRRSAAVRQILHRCWIRWIYMYYNGKYSEAHGKSCKNALASKNTSNNNHKSNTQLNMCQLFIGSSVFRWTKQALRDSIRSAHGTWSRTACSLLRNSMVVQCACNTIYALVSINIVNFSRVRREEEPHKIKINNKTANTCVYRLDM